ncbi:MAG TPA: BrnT family toxin [Acetobacteraceae bacterium]
MEYEWDEAKRRSNLAKHGVDFAQNLEFEWSSAVIRQDRRRNYGERRRRAQGRIGDRLYTLVYTEREHRTRVISLRKAKQQEVDFYDIETAVNSPDA